MAKALTSGLRAAMERDPKVMLMGEDIGKLGGVFRITEGCKRTSARTGSSTPRSPKPASSATGDRAGAARLPPVVEIQFDGFVYPAFDHIVSTIAKMRARSLGHVELPIVVRIPFGGGIGAVEHHSESNEAYFAHTAGLRVVVCSNPHDAHWMIQQAIECRDPVIFYEPKRRYWDKGEIGPAPSRGLFEAATVRPGTDVTVLAYGPMVRTTLQAAQAAEEEGTSLEVIDLRSLSPLDTGRHPRVGPPHGSLHRRARGVNLPRARRRTRRADPGEVLLLAGGARLAGRWLQRALSAEPDRGGLPP
jgi:2-oxoisovalerate dehydrogenase E1 component beta subunit